MKRIYYDIYTFFWKKIMNVMESNFYQNFLCTALIIGKNICLHFRIWTMEKSTEFILDDKLTWV